MKVLSLLAAPLLVSASPLLAERQATRSIDKLLKGVGKIYFGAATEVEKFSNGNTGAIMENNMGQATNEYLMKWTFTEPNRGDCNLDGAKKLVDWAESKGKSIRGHTLVWDDPLTGSESLPDWVRAITDKEDLKKAIRDHINCVVGGFKGRVRAWDVVNEIFAEDHAGLKPTHFYNVLGEEYVRVAFEAAHAADPAAKLYINDYGLDDVSWMKFQPGGIVDKVREWRANNIPIHGIGSQTHLAASKFFFAPRHQVRANRYRLDHAAGVETALRTLATVVDEVAITELDIEGRKASEYVQAVEACFHVPSCVGITLWGVCSADKTLFDANCNPTEAYNKIADYLEPYQKPGLGN
jgi:endo-1,4-beta-xylanase